jgi:hypothetical protein
MMNTHYYFLSSMIKCKQILKNTYNIMNIRVKKGMEKVYQDTKKELERIKIELVMKHMMNGWLVNELEKQKENLTTRLNECIDE